MSAVQPEGGTPDLEKPEAEGLDHWAPSKSQESSQIWRRALGSSGPDFGYKT